MIDNDGFCQQIRGLEDAMYALAYSILRNDQDAADAISESVLEGVLRAAPTQKPKRLQVVDAEDRQ